MNPFKSKQNLLSTEYLKLQEKVGKKPTTASLLNGQEYNLIQQ